MDMNLDSSLKRKVKKPKIELTDAYKASQEQLLIMTIIKAIKRFKVVRIPCKRIECETHKLNGLLREEAMYSVVRIELMTYELGALIFQTVQEELKLGATDEAQTVIAIMINELGRILKVLVKDINEAVDELEVERSLLHAQEKFNKKIDVRVWSSLDGYFKKNSNLPGVIANHQSCMFVESAYVSEKEVKYRIDHAKVESLPYRSFDDLID